jgi:AraC-like DNA-binding protein
LTELIIQANQCMETDQEQARRCIQRAAELVRSTGGCSVCAIDPLAACSGLAAWQRKKLTAYIDSNIGQKILTRDLAAHVQMSPGHFFRMFRISFEMSPHRYIMNRRVQRAELMMATSGESLARIAFACGLSDQAHFSRIFRSIVGVSPSDWRRNREARSGSEDSPFNEVVESLSAGTAPGIA